MLYYREEISKVDRREASRAMILGQVFEYRLFGTKAKEGNVPVIPLMKNKRNGSLRSASDLRIDEQVKIFRDEIVKKNIKVVRTDFYVEVIFNNEIVFHGTMDVLTDYNGKPYILDVKFTANVNSTFGMFCWGDFDNMDKLQAHAYMWIMKRLTGREWGFLYAVFDHKPEIEHKFLEVPYSQEEQDKLEERLKGAKVKLQKLKDMNYEPIPSADECKTCKFMECTERIQPEPEEGIEQESLDSQLKASVKLVIDKDNPF